MEKETKSILNTQEDGTNKLNDNNKKIQEINLKIKEIRTERDKCIKLTKVRELIEYYKLCELMIQTDSFDEERVLYLEKMDLREKTKINIGNIARKANEEINALKLEKLNLKGNNKKKYTIEDINKKSLEQTKKSLESIIINNLDVFKSYAMLTYTENVDNIDIAFDSFRNYMLEVKRHLKRAGKELCYICVPEIKEGEAINFHVLWNERIGTNTIPIKIKKEVMFEDEIVTIECYDLPLWWHGTSIAFKIETLDDALKITKHLTKAINNVDNDKLYPKQKILKSKKLKISKEST